MPNQEEDLKNADYVAKRLGISVFTVYPLARSGAIPSIRVGKSWKFQPSAIDAYIARGGNADEKPHCN